ncbi:unnamed protein product [Rotaria sp. Silwood1]|nr:unnamed protein product [Rotaria sp. Silwood1]CAF4937340.1 unnamed protein product [Rotaria sp. Silwood1]
MSASPFPRQHAPNKDKQVVSQFAAQLKMETEKARTISASKLRNDLATRMNLIDTQMAALPKATAIERVLYRARSKTLPPVPKDLSFDIPPAFKTTANVTLV